jgi:two-component system, OmpR family, phosphate regulon sensor histidine kinase PhoR
MVYNSRALALFLALCISVVTALFLSLFESVSVGPLVVAGMISFSVSYFSIYMVLEFLIFREISVLHKVMAKLKKRELPKLEKQQSATISTLKNIHDEIFSFAELKQKEIDELKKLEAFRREFIADVSHELKTPIFAAQGFLHTLLDGAVDDENVRMKFLRKAAKSLDGLDVLVQDLLTLSHIETRQIKMQFGEVDLYKLTEEVFEQFEGKTDTKNVSLKLDSPSRRVMAWADHQRIRQVLTNLVSNAIKHSFEDGVVKVVLEKGRRNVEVSVTDHGEGIPAEHLPRIFERFYRVDKSRSREKGGTGLGLAIVKHILESHKSKAEVDSTSGKGSTFSFKLPRFNPEVVGEGED